MNDETLMLSEHDRTNRELHAKLVELSKQDGRGDLLYTAIEFDQACAESSGALWKHLRKTRLTQH